MPAAPVRSANVLFACVHNAGRSQMAAAIFNRHADPARARAISAGTNPAERVHPEVAAAMTESGIDLGGALPRRLTLSLATTADLLVTMGCGEDCPVVSGLERLDWAIPDPKGRSAAEVTAILVEIERRVLGLIRSRGWK